MKTVKRAQRIHKKREKIRRKKALEKNSQYLGEMKVKIKELKKEKLFSLVCDYIMEKAAAGTEYTNSVYIMRKVFNYYQSQLTTVEVDFAVYYADNFDEVMRQALESEGFEVYYQRSLHRSESGIWIINWRST